MPVAFSDVEALPAAAAAAEYRYGAAPSQFARLWLPGVSAEPGNGSPVIVLIHGGCWLQRYDLVHVSSLAAALAARGFAVWVPEYRRVGEDGGGWPGTADDVYAAIMSLQVVPGLDLQQVLLAGHSAGGQLALWAASQAPAFASHNIIVQGVVGLAAITDLEAYARGSNSCEKVTPQFMGGTPEQVPEHYATASPAELGLQLPTILVHGSADPLVSPAQAHALVGAEVINIEGAGHFDLIHPHIAAFQVLVAALNRLLEPAP
ncbi:alpha/beta hydrolase family protein [Kineobactrum sediminis]|nr:alpha/beta fold hydrolase [Kineobactrum sediminis]